MTVSVLKFLRRAIVAFTLLAAVAVPALPLVAAQPAVGVEAQAGGAAQEAVRGGGEASLVLPDLSTVDFSGINGRTLLMGGLVVCVLGLLFGLTTFTQLRNLPVHASMLE